MDPEFRREVCLKYLEQIVSQMAARALEIKEIPQCGNTTATIIKNVLWAKSFLDITLLNLLNHPLKQILLFAFSRLVIEPQKD